MKRALLALLLPFAASAQLQLFIAPPGTDEQVLTGIYDMGSVPVSEASSVRFRLRNVGKTSTTLSYLYVAGTGFSMSGAPSLPYIVAPGVNVDFTVRFSPPDFGSYSANLQVNATGYLFRGAGLPGATVRVRSEDIPTGGSIDFRRAERGTSSSVTVSLVNTTTQSVPLSSISVSGAGYTLPSPPGLSTLAPGAVTTFDIVFSPASAGILTGILTIDQRSFRLTGSGFEPAMPRPTVIIETPSIRSGEQGRVSIRLASPSKASAKGQLRMELRPAGTMKDNDTAAQFMSGSRSMAFDVAPGDEVVRLRGDTSAIFQSGTTAGTIVFVVEAGGFTEQTSMTIAPEPVRLDKVSGTRTGSSLEVQLTGFDNTRSIGDMTFTFYTAAGPLAAPVKANAASEFGNWWAASQLGGIFQMKAAFPVTGDASKIIGADVQIVSSAGTATTQRITF